MFSLRTLCPSFVWPITKLMPQHSLSTFAGGEETRFLGSSRLLFWTRIKSSSWRAVHPEDALHFSNPNLSLGQHLISAFAEANLIRRQLFDAHQQHELGFFAQSRSVKMIEREEDRLDVH